ncbi:MAG: outer membrane protein assembly factor BamD [Candidatus Calescibacterium sp.]|nr:outer membrane protein assembly factor BamD [Candidatus Calescibacterium sp.]MCX7734791.1 outer membrane protein assembly factor BamD [bacterium]MDW8087382.1 outer membrane protein assembly factor BamD [Candidatus Calescibacterium sp.]
MRVQLPPSARSKLKKTTIAIISSLLLIKLTHCSHSEPPNTPEELYAEAMKKTEGGIFTADLETAEEYFRKIIELFPTSKYVPKANFGIAYVKMKKGNYAEAGPLFEVFFQRYRSHPQAPDALYLAIKCYLEFVDTPDRDITYAVKVRELSSIFIKNFPENDKIKEVQNIKQRMLEIIAQHNLEIAEFYARRKLFEPSIERINEILKDEELSQTKFRRLAEELKIRIQKQRQEMNM